MIWHASQTRDRVGPHPGGQIDALLWGLIEAEREHDEWTLSNAVARVRDGDGCVTEVYADGSYVTTVDFRIA